MPNVNQNSREFTGTVGIIPAGHTCGHITADGGDVTLTFENGDTYVIADGETFPIWHMGEPYHEIRVSAPGTTSAKCSWIMA